MRIDIDEIAPGLNSRNGLMRMHHRTYSRLRDRWQLLIMEQVADRKPVADRVRITITRRTRSTTPMDTDNLYSSAKVPLDALRKVKLIRDDDPGTVVSLTMLQETRCMTSTTTIEIEPA